MAEEKCLDIIQTYPDIFPTGASTHAYFGITPETQGYIRNQRVLTGRPS